MNTAMEKLSLFPPSETGAGPRASQSASRDASGDEDRSFDTVMNRQAGGQGPGPAEHRKAKAEATGREAAGQAAGEAAREDAAAEAIPEADAAAGAATTGALATGPAGDLASWLARRRNTGPTGPDEFPAELAPGSQPAEPADATAAAPAIRRQQGANAPLDAGPADTQAALLAASGTMTKDKRENGMAAGSGKHLPPGGNPPPPLMQAGNDGVRTAPASPLEQSLDEFFGKADNKIASASQGDAQQSGARRVDGLAALLDAARAPNQANADPRASGDPAGNPGSGAGPTLGSATRTAGSAFLPGFFLHNPAGSEAWQAELGHRIRWMGRLDMPIAELRLNPAELGSLEVRISTDDERATVSFQASNAAARELIEQSLPRLRELLAGSGLQLEHGSVDAGQGGEGRRSPDTAAQAGGRAEAGEDAPLPGGVSLPEARGLVDHYV